VAFCTIPMIPVLIRRPGAEVLARRKKKVGAECAALKRCSTRKSECSTQKRKPHSTKSALSGAPKSFSTLQVRYWQKRRGGVPGREESHLLYIE
jgi:hypothetical protein